MSYENERHAFVTLKQNMTEALVREYLQAIGGLHSQYNTTIRENRFIVGGAIEVFTHAILLATGVQCENCATTSESGDIRLATGEMLSIKASGTGITNVKLMNKLGEGDRHWDTATLFIVPSVGIVYGDPSLVSAKHIKQDDGITLAGAGLQALADDPANVIAMDIPRKSKSDVSESKVASHDVAWQVLRSMELQQLIKALEAAN